MKYTKAEINAHIQNQLLPQGLWIAGPEEPGWYVIVTTPDDSVTKIWATDEE